MATYCIKFTLFSVNFTILLYILHSCNNFSLFKNVISTCNLVNIRLWTEFTQCYKEYIKSEKSLNLIKLDVNQACKIMPSDKKKYNQLINRFEKHYNIISAIISISTKAIKF